MGMILPSKVTNRKPAVKTQASKNLPILSAFGRLTLLRTIQQSERHQHAHADRDRARGDGAAVFAITGC